MKTDSLLNGERKKKKRICFENSLIEFQEAVCTFLVTYVAVEVQIRKQSAVHASHVSVMRDQSAELPKLNSSTNSVLSEVHRERTRR